MSILGRKVPLKTVAALAALMVMAALLPVMTTGAVDRDITLVARGMTFYLESDPESPNPTITVKAGERVRITLRNHDRGMRHDVAVPAVEAGLQALDWNESGEVIFEAPSTPGTYEYVCRPHLLMMRGILRVE